MKKVKEEKGKKVVENNNAKKANTILFVNNLIALLCAGLTAVYNGVVGIAGVVVRVQVDEFSVVAIQNITKYLLMGLGLDFFILCIYMVINHFVAKSEDTKVMYVMTGIGVVMSIIYGIRAVTLFF